MKTGARFLKVPVTFCARNHCWNRNVKNRSAGFCFINWKFYYDICKTIEISICNVNGDSLPNWKTSNFLCEHIYDISSIKRVTRKFHVVVDLCNNKRKEMYKKCAAQLDLMIYFYRFRCRRPECPVPILSYFLSPFLFSPIFKPKPPIFPIFLLVKPKCATKLKMEYK